MELVLALQIAILPLLLASWWGNRLERVRITYIYKRSLVRLEHLNRR